LLVLYGLSLISELLCNDRPLYVRYRGRSFFPVCAFYPEGRFTGNGSQARPDYLGLRGTAAFAPGSGNFMIFPPVPHSPYGSADPDSLARAAKVTLTFTPLPRVGTADIRRDLTVARSVNCDYFFDGDDAAPAGVAITNVWPLPGDLQRAVDARFANRPAPAIEVAVARRRARPQPASRPSRRAASRPPPCASRCASRSSGSGSRAWRSVWTASFRRAARRSGTACRPESASG
jgi:microcin C transport system permease protein